MKTLHLGAGRHTAKTPEDTFLDLRPFDRIDIVHDLNSRPWPIPDSEYEHISALHVVEHLETKLLPFMNECWRILKQGGSMYLTTPDAGGDVDLAWCDPTHVRLYRPYSFLNYFSPEGVERFGYTDKPWMFSKCESVDSEIRVHAWPIKNL